MSLISRLVFVLVMLCPWHTYADEPSEASRRPNVILFLVDDLGWRDLGCYGSTFYHTRAVAEEGNLRVALLDLAGQYPTYGYRRLTGWMDNHIMLGQRHGFAHFSGAVRNEM